MIAKHTAIYTVGTVLRNIATFLMLPIYTRYLTPSDYGVIELLSMVIDLFAIVFGLRIGDAVFRHHALYDGRKDKNQVISTAIALVGALTLAGYVLISSLAGPISAMVFKDGGHADQIALFATTLPLVAVTEIAFLYLRAERRPWTFVLFSSMRLALQLGLNIYFVVVREWHVDGVIYGAVISNILVAGLILAFTLRKTGFSVSLRKASELARFSWPLIVAALAVFYLTFGDRYLLQIHTDTAEVGIYSLGYRFGLLLLVFPWGPFASVWDAQRYVIAKRPGASGEFNLLFTLVSAALISCALCVGVFVEDVLRFMSDESFWRASDVAHIIIVAYVFQAWTHFTNLGILMSGKTINIAIGTAIGCVAMTLVALPMIPRFAATGAAIAVLSGFVLRFLWIYYTAKRYYDMNLRWTKVLKIAALALVIYGVSLASPDEFGVSVLVHAVELIAFFVLVLVLPILGPDERDRILGFFKNLRGRREVADVVD